MIRTKFAPAHAFTLLLVARAATSLVTPFKSPSVVSVEVVLQPTATSSLLLMIADPRAPHVVSILLVVRAALSLVMMAATLPLRLPPKLPAAPVPQLLRAMRPLLPPPRALFACTLLLVVPAATSLAKLPKTPFVVFAEVEAMLTTTSLVAPMIALLRAPHVVSILLVARAVWSLVMMAATLPPRLLLLPLKLPAALVAIRQQKSPLVQLLPRALFVFTLLLVAPAATSSAKLLKTRFVVFAEVEVMLTTTSLVAPMIALPRAPRVASTLLVARAVWSLVTMVATLLPRLLLPPPLKPLAALVAIRKPLPAQLLPRALFVCTLPLVAPAATFLVMLLRIPFVVFAAEVAMLTVTSSALQTTVPRHPSACTLLLAVEALASQLCLVVTLLPRLLDLGVCSRIRRMPTTTSLVDQRTTSQRLPFAHTRHQVEPPATSLASQLDRAPVWVALHSFAY